LKNSRKQKATKMRFQFTMLTLATILSAGTVSAQQVVQEPSQAKVTQSNQSKPVDNRLTKEHILAKCLEITNQEVVAIATLAKEKSTNEEVKALAMTLEKSHKEILAKLKAIETKITADKKSPGSDSVVASRPNADEVDFLKMHQEISDQCIKGTKEMLSKKVGKDFDSWFLGIQIAKHGMMHSSFSVLQRHTSGELQELIKSSLVKNDEHMKAAIGLMERLTDRSLANTPTVGK
jgi:predicted outer membrane protein